MVKLPPSSQGRMPPQGSPFAAFSGTPSAPFTEYGTKAAQTMTGSHNMHRPIIIFLFVVSSVIPSFRGSGPLASLMTNQCKAALPKLQAELQTHLTIVSRLRSTLTRPRAVAQFALRKLKLFGCTNGDRQASVVIVHPALPVIRRTRRSIDAAPGIIVARQSLRRPMILDLPKIRGDESLRWTEPLPGTALAAALPLATAP